MKNNIFLIESDIIIARGTCHSPDDTHYSSAIDSLHTRVCLVPIRLIVAQKWAQECTHVCHILAFLVNSTADISRAKTMGENPFFQARVTRLPCTPTVPFLD